MSHDKPRPPSSPSRRLIALAVAGPVLALLLWTAHAALGRPFVEAMYAGRLPIDLLNQVIDGQSVHAVEYHLGRAQQLVDGLSLLLLLTGPLAAAQLVWTRRRPGSALSHPVLAIGAAATLLLCGLYVLRVPLLDAFPGWFWDLHDRALPLWWLAVPIAGVSWWTITALPRLSLSRGLALLIAWGLLLQHGFVWLEGDGFERLQLRLTDTGHAVFARAAVDGPEPWEVAMRYDELLADGALDARGGYFHATKPPGLQVLMTSLARVSGGGFDRFAAVAALWFPLLACLCVVPLAGLAREWLPQAPAQMALVAGALFLTAPNVVLINLHADQFLYPLLAVGCLWLFDHSLQPVASGARHVLQAVLAGGLFYVCLWSSFALVALLPAVPVIAWCRRGENTPGGTARAIGLGTAGLAATYLIFLWGADYDALTRWSAAVAAHGAAKGLQWSVAERVYYAVLNVVEFALWCGPLLIVLAVGDVRRTLRRTIRGESTGADGLVLSLAVIVPLVSVAGGTAGETARLWLFLVPLVAVAASRSLHRLPPTAMRWVVGLQLLLVFVMKARQDFY